MNPLCVVSCRRLMIAWFGRQTLSSSMGMSIWVTLVVWLSHRLPIAATWLSPPLSISTVEDLLKVPLVRTWLDQSGQNLAFKCTTNFIHSAMHIPVCHTACTLVYYLPTHSFLEHTSARAPANPPPPRTHSVNHHSARALDHSSPHTQSSYCPCSRYPLSHPTLCALGTHWVILLSVL